MVFGSMSLAILVLSEGITSARTLSAGFAGLITALAFAAGVAVQPIARRVSNPLAGDVAGLCCAAAGAGLGVVAVADTDRVLAGGSAVLFGLAYGLCLVSGLRQAEQMARPGERGAVVACYYALASLGFAAPYLADGLDAVSGKAGAFAVLAGIAVLVAAWTAGYALRLGRAERTAAAEARTRGRHGPHRPESPKTWHHGPSGIKKRGSTHEADRGLAAGQAHEGAERADDPYVAAETGDQTWTFPITAASAGNSRFSRPTKPVAPGCRYGCPQAPPSGLRSSGSSSISNAITATSMCIPLSSPNANCTSGPGTGRTTATTCTPRCR